MGDSRRDQLITSTDGSKDYKGDKNWGQSHISWLPKAADASQPGSTSHTTASTTDSTTDQDEVSPSVTADASQQESPSQSAPSTTESTSGPDSESTSETNAENTVLSPEDEDFPLQVRRVLSDAWYELSFPQRNILTQRTGYYGSRKTLQAIAEERNVTRERVRQIQFRAESILRKSCATVIEMLISRLQQLCGEVCSEEDFETAMIELFPWGNQPEENVLRDLVRRSANYRTVNGVVLSRQAHKRIQEFRSAAHEHKDKVGLIDESIFREIDGKIWNNKSRGMLMQACNFYAMPGDLISLRNSNVSKLKAAVKGCQPATKQQIADYSGLSLTFVERDLWSVPGVCKKTHKLWALEESVDRPYKGVVEEIKHRIHQDYGSTRVSRIMKELPELYDVSEISVSAFLHTPQFKIDNGWVSIRKAEDLKLKPLQDTVDGFESDGSPYWKFKVVARYLRGYTATGFCAEMANHLGCEPNEAINVPVRYPDGCRDVSVAWRLASTNGVQVGYLMHAIKKLGAQAGDELRLVVRAGQVEFHKS